MGYSYVGNNGTMFFCDKRDLSEPITVIRWDDLPLDRFVSDVVSMAADHATRVHPILESFAGYDCLRFVIEEKKS